MKERAYKGTLGAVFAAALVLCSLPAMCADNTPVWVSYGNPYIQAMLGTSGKIKISDDTEVDVAGRWAMTTIEGDPETSEDDNKEIIWFGSHMPAGNYGFWKLRIGIDNYVIGDSTTGGWLINGAISNKPAVYSYPVSDSDAGDYVAGGFINATWRTNIDSSSWVDFAIKIRLVRDLARFELTITNHTKSTQPIGLAMHGDVEVTNSLSTAYPFIPGMGFTRSNIYPDYFVATLFGPNYTTVPDYFEIYDNLANPALVTRNVLNQEDATKPDWVAIGNYIDLGSYNLWLPDRTPRSDYVPYEPDQTKPVSDYYWVLCWNQKSLAREASRTFVTYYGVGAASSRWTRANKQQDSAVLAVQGPRALKYDTTAGNPTTLDPAAFTVKAYVDNLAVCPGPYDLDDAVVSISLPEGLTLAPGETRTKSIGAVLRNTEAAPVSWDVEATGKRSGDLEYFITASGVTNSGSDWNQTVTRKIMIPADKQKVFEYGWQLVSVPFGFNDPSIPHVFGLSQGTFGAKYWDPVNSPKAGGSYFQATQVEPGQGFWMAVSAIESYGDTLPLPLAADARILGQSTGKQILEQTVVVYPGWNMIGNPFVYPVYWGQVLVYDKSLNKTFSLDEAVSRRWLNRTLCAWNPNKWAYDYIMQNDQLLIPFQGYWLYLKSLTPKTLVFRPAVFPSADVTAGVSGF